MIIFRRRFQPGWLITLITCLGVLAFFSLASWQLQRAEYKEAAKQLYETRLNAGFREFDARESLADIEYQKLSLEGEYDTRRTMLQDNKIFQGRAGYHVITPFRLRGSNSIVLVDRGWVAVGDRREILPDIPEPAGVDRIRGIASIPVTEGYRLGQVALQESWPQVIPFIDIAAMQQSFDNRLLPLIIWLDAEQAGHFERDWRPVWADPDKSRAYAGQWFAFGLIAIALYLILNLRKIK